MFWEAFNFIVSVFSQIVDFFFFTDLGGANMATFIGGMFVFGIAWKVLVILMGVSVGKSPVSSAAKHEQMRSFRKGK